MENNEKEMMKQTADAITEKTVTFTVDILQPAWWEKLRKRTKKKFTLPPASLGTLAKISKELQTIGDYDRENPNYIRQGINLMHAHSEQLVRIVALAIVNRKKEPSEKLVDFLLYNLTPEELMKLTAGVLKQMDISNFINSIIFIKGVNVLEMSPKEQGS